MKRDRDLPAGTVRLPTEAVWPTTDAARAAPTTDVSVADATAVLASVRDVLCDGLTLHEAVDDWNDRVDTWNRRGQRVVLWGRPDRAVALLALLNRGVPVDALVSDQTGFLARTALPLCSAADLREDPADVVISVGPATVDEVRSALDALGLAPRVYALS